MAKIESAEDGVKAVRAALKDSTPTLVAFGLHLLANQKEWIGKGQQCNMLPIATKFAEEQPKLAACAVLAIMEISAVLDSGLDLRKD